MSDAIASFGIRELQNYVARAGSDGALRDMHLVGSGAIADLESKLRGHYGMRHAICVSNATIGLLAIGLALGMRRKEFITTPYTYGATVAGWLLLGNRMAFADIDADTLTIDPDSVEKAIKPKTKAILSVDIFGNPADQVALRKMANDHGLWLVSDAAQSLGAFRDGLPASSLSDALVVSFTVGKTVFAGEGGAILTNNSELYAKLVWYTQHPMRQRRELGLHLDNEFGLNARIHPLAAIWANAAFNASLNRLQEHRTQCFRLVKVLNRSRTTRSQDFENKGLQPSFFRVTAAWNGEVSHDKLRSHLHKAGFAVRLQSPPVRLLYKNPALLAQYSRKICKPVSCKVAEDQSHKRFCIAL